MSTELDEMRQRQDGFDMRLTTLEDKVEAEATMRAAMAQHISDIRTEQLAQRGLLQAVALTQSDQNARFLRVERQLTGMDDRLTHLAGQVVGMGDRLTSVEGRLTGVEGRLTGVEADLGEVKERLGNVENRLGNVENRLDRVEHGLGNVQVGVQTIIAILDRQIDETSDGPGENG